MASTANVSPIRGQLTFEIGGELPAPETSSLSLTGTGTFRRELYMDDSVTIRVVGGDGQIVAEFTGAVVDVGFKKHPEKTNKDGDVTENAYVERKHKIKLQDDE